MIGTNFKTSNSKKYARYLGYYAKRNYMLLVLAALFISGVLAGTFLLKAANSDTFEIISQFVTGFAERRREQTLLKNLLSTASSSVTFIAIMFVCGFCAISQPLVVLTPFLRGLGYGFSAALLFSSYGVNATAFVAFFMLPDMLISSIAILLCCRESLRLSNNFWSMMWNPSREGIYPLKIFLGRYFAAVILCLLSAFFASVIHYAFANYITLV